MSWHPSSDTNGRTTYLAVDTEVAADTATSVPAGRLHVRTASAVLTRVVALDGLDRHVLHRGETYFKNSGDKLSEQSRQINNNTLGQITDTLKRK